MSETKAKVKVKGESATKTKLAKPSLAGEVSVKVKKEEQEPESPAPKKKHSEAPAKSVKKEIDVSVKEESSKSKKSEAGGKVKVVKKEEALVSSGKKKKISNAEPEKKGKKVYSLPGQKHDPPDERDPLRIFYESLYTQNSGSEMAEIWMMEHGLLEHDAAKKAFERKKKNQGSQKLASPVKQVKHRSEKTKSSTAVVVKSQKMTSTEKLTKKSTTPNGESKPSKIKRIRDSDDDEDDDFLVKPKKKSKTNA